MIAASLVIGFAAVGAALLLDPTGSRADRCCPTARSGSTR